MPTLTVVAPQVPEPPQPEPQPGPGEPYPVPDPGQPYPAPDPRRQARPALTLLPHIVSERDEPTPPKAA